MAMLVCGYEADGSNCAYEKDWSTMAFQSGELCFGRLSLEPWWFSMEDSPEWCSGCDSFSFLMSGTPLEV